MARYQDRLDTAVFQVLNQSPHVREPQREGGESLCESSRTSLGNCQQDAAAYISNLPPVEQREFQTGHVGSERSAGKFINCVLCVGTHQRGEP